MISFIKRNKENLESLASLYLNNAVTYLLPLLIVPFLIKVIGIDHYGYFVFAFAFASYFKIIVDFGFDITVTKQIVARKDDKEKLSQIVSFVLMCRVGLFLLSTALFVLVAYFIPLVEILGWPFFLFNYFYVFSSVVNMNAFYYAFKDVKYITIANTIFKVAYFLGLVGLVKSAQDLNTVAVLSSLSWVLPAFALFLYGLYRYKLKIVRFSFRDFNEVMNEAKNAFISDFSVGLYGTSTTFILGLTAPPYIVGIYSGVEKIFNAFTNLLGSASYVLYPVMIEYYNKGREVLKKILIKIEIGYFAAALGVSLIMYLSKDLILRYIFGTDLLDELTSRYYHIFSFALLFSPFGYLYTRMFLILNLSGKLVRITFVGFLINLIVLGFMLVVWKNWDYLPVAVLIVQMYIAVAKRFLIRSSWEDTP